MADRVLAVDLGGTRMRAAIVTPDGEIHERRADPTPRDAECPDAVLRLAGDVIAAGAVGRAVIGVPGRVDYAGGRLEHAPNLPPHWPGALDEALLADRLGMPVTIANDADLATVGEAFFGAGVAFDDVAYITVSTGVGAGVVLGRRLVAGRRSGIELGHTVVDIGAASNDQPASVEDLASGTALERAAAERGLPADGATLVDAVLRGDEAARAVWNQVVAVISTAVTNVAYLFTPQIIILGGGVGSNGDLILDPLRTHLRDAGPPDLLEPIELTVAATGDDAGLVGAAGWDTATCQEHR
ncbi:MAG: ROK family protein [Actinomycetota bacterium]|nr:ROK family protein [Actinomycetota bacterium]